MNPEDFSTNVSKRLKYSGAGLEIRVREDPIRRSNR